MIGYVIVIGWVLFVLALIVTYWRKAARGEKW